MFLAWSFSTDSIPIEGKELTLVSERSLERQKVKINSVEHKAEAALVSSHVQYLQNKEIIKKNSI